MRLRDADFDRYAGLLRRRSAQWLADKTGELGYQVSRTTISDLENGRRRYVTTAELVVLALALDTAPIALMYPGPYFDRKIRLAPKWAEFARTRCCGMVFR